MKDVRVVRRDRLRLGAALEGRNLLPEVIQHRVRRRVPVVRAPMHLAAGHDVDRRQFLIEHRRLGGAILRIGHRRHRKLAN